jgi:hypothetical protein
MHHLNTDPFGITGYYFGVSLVKIRPQDFASVLANVGLPLSNTPCHTDTVSHYKIFHKGCALKLGDLYSLQAAYVAEEGGGRSNAYRNKVIESTR